MLRDIQKGQSSLQGENDKDNDLENLEKRKKQPIIYEINENNPQGDVTVIAPSQLSDIYCGIDNNGPRKESMFHGKCKKEKAKLESNKFSGPRNIALATRGNFNFKNKSNGNTRGKKSKTDKKHQKRDTQKH